MLSSKKNRAVLKFSFYCRENKKYWNKKFKQKTLQNYFNQLYPLEYNKNSS